MKPVRVSRATLGRFQAANAVHQIVDRYDELAEDLFLTRNPRFKFDHHYEPELALFKERELKKETVGEWFYFPWTKTLAYYLRDDLHQELRTARNKELIREEEQKAFYNFKIGVAGLSVGSHAALTIAMMGGGRVMRVADPDSISPSNLNRIRAPFTDVGKSKCQLVEHFLYEINPYSDIAAYENGICARTLEAFIDGLDVVVDAVDNLELKIRLRLAAREHSIPVIMATDNGDNVIFDIERYDLDSSLELFGGAIGPVSLSDFQTLQFSEMPKLATRIAGANLVVPRMLESVAEVGKTLYSWPQLGSAATLAGVCTAYAIKRMALRKPIRAGKIELNLDAVFDPDYHLRKNVERRETERKRAQMCLGLG